MYSIILISTSLVGYSSSKEVRGTVCENVDIVMISFLMGALSKDSGLCGYPHWIAIYLETGFWISFSVLWELQAQILGVCPPILIDLCLLICLDLTFPSDLSLSFSFSLSLSLYFYLSLSFSLSLQFSFSFSFSFQVSFSNLRVYEKSSSLAILLTLGFLASVIQSSLTSTKSCRNLLSFMSSYLTSLCQLMTSLSFLLNSMVSFSFTNFKAPTYSFWAWMALFNSVFLASRLAISQELLACSFDLTSKYSLVSKPILFSCSLDIIVLVVSCRAELSFSSSNSFLVTVKSFVRRVMTMSFSLISSSNL